MKNLVLVCAGLVGTFSTAAHAELLNVACAGTKNGDTLNVEYLVDTTAKLDNFLDANVTSWTLAGTKLVARTSWDRQMIFDSETNLVRADGKLVDKERISCTWEIAETTTSAPNDDALLAITKQIDEIQKRLSTLESKQ
jgi:hypothetical protein